AERLTALVVVEVVRLSVLPEEGQARNVSEGVAEGPDVEVWVAVEVVVEEDCGRARRLEVEAHLAGAVGEGSVAVVAEEPVRREVARDEEVLEAVVVRVGEDAGVGLVKTVEARLRGHVNEFDLAAC